MSINLETGLWRCFKTGNTGNFPKLYAKMEGCSYKTAYEKFVFKNLLVEQPVPEKEKVITNIDLSDESSDFQEVLDDDSVAANLLRNRWLPTEGFYYAEDALYAGRLIIPFFNSKGKLFFFQARSLGDKQPKYLNCRALKSSQVLYPFEYDSYEPLYITEGVFDCLSLKCVGLNSTTTLSCVTSKAQMDQLKQYQGPLVCAFDNDEPGREGAQKFMKIAHSHNTDNIKYVHPPNPYKDWNEVLIKEGPDYLVEACSWTEALTKFNLDTIGLRKLNRQNR